MFKGTPMNLRGFLETSLLDWDGKVSSVIFVPDCNFRCPFCSNWLLVHEPESLPEVNIETIENFLHQRKDFIDAVVITGGEPTIHPWLTELIKRLRALDMQIKLDTNGTNPSMLAKLIKQKLIDYVAMDIKAPLNEKYDEATDTKVDLNKIAESLRLIIESGIDHEFRTTVTPNLLAEGDIEAIAKSLVGAKKYVLQQFVPSHSMIKEMKALTPYPREKLFALVGVAKLYVPNTIVRGV
jgi:pyruvate formate lyase activating enzyme